MSHPNFTLHPVGQLRTLIPLSTAAGVELEVTTEPASPSTWVTTLVRRWRSSNDGVIITVEESEPHTYIRSRPHPEMTVVAAHAHALEYLESMGPEDLVLRQMIMRGRITAPTIEEDPRRLDDPLGWHDEL